MAQELRATLTGTATLTIQVLESEAFGGPYVQQLSLEPVFSADRKTVTIDSFPPIKIGPIAEAMNDVITITMIGGGVGTFQHGTGHIDLPLTLLFDHSLPGIVAGDSEFPLELTTRTSPAFQRGFFPDITGSPLSRATGDLKLVDISRFQGGFLGFMGSPQFPQPREGRIIIEATVNPLPFVVDQFQPPVYAQGEPGDGIGGYDLASPLDQAFAFDFDHSRKLDHLVLFRPAPALSTS